MGKNDFTGLTRINPTQRYVTGGDYIDKNTNILTIGNLYRWSKNSVVDIRFDTSNVTDMSNMFYNCDSMIAVTPFDTSNVTSMSYMFNNCSKLVSVPQFDTSNVTSMSYMFSGCSKLVSVPQFDTSNVTDMSNMFNNCSKLVSVPQFDTSNVTSMSYMFSGCSYLESIPELYCGSITTNSNMNIFGSNYLNNLTDLGGFTDLGKVKGFSQPSYFINQCPYLTKESLLNVINKLYDRASAGYSVVKIRLLTNHLALLTDDDIAIATTKGWTLTT